MQQKKEMDDKYEKMTKTRSSSFKADSKDQKIKAQTKRDSYDFHYKDPNTGIVNRDFQYKLPENYDDSKKTFVSNLVVPNQK